MSSVQLLTLTVFACVMAQGAQAGFINLDSVATGSIEQYVVRPGGNTYFEEYTSENPLETLGYTKSFQISGRPISYRTEARGYAVFDVSTFAGMVNGATLELDLQRSTGNLSGTQLSVRTVDSATAAELAANPVGTQSAGVSIDDFPDPPAALFEALASQYGMLGAGTEAGLFAQSGTYNGLFEIELNAIAVDLINAGGGLFALGLQSIDDTGCIFCSDTLTVNRAPRLILTSDSFSVPVPATLWLVGAALMLLIRRPA